MRIGVVVLPDESLAEQARRYARIEELGFAYAWTYDHLVWGGLPDAPWHSTTVALAVAAQATHRVEVGTWMSSPNFRHPAPWARDLVSLQELSGGRLVCGVGSGGVPDAGLLREDDPAMAERTADFHEFTRVLRRARDEPTLDHAGDAYRIRGLRNELVRTTPRVPLVVAANGPRGVRLAADVGDGWATAGRPGAPLEQWWGVVADLARQYADAGGRGRRMLSLDSAPRFSLETAAFFADQVGRAEALGFTDVVVHWPRGSDPYRESVAALEEVAARHTAGPPAP